MASWIVATIVLCLSVTTVTSAADGSSCQDIDTTACILFVTQKPDYCNDTVISSRTCPKYCKQCPLECYQCKTTVADFHMCNTTTLCAKGEVCMQKKLTSFVDSHVEYELTCESKQACDGQGLLIGFGKRSIQSRDVSVSCCDKDMCNYPEEMTTPIALSAAPTTSMFQGCKKDVFVIVDESRSLVHSSSKIVDFLQNVFSSLAIGQNGVLMSLATFASSVKPRWDLSAHTDTSDLTAALSGVQLHGGTGDLNVAIQYAIEQVKPSGANGNRPDASDVVLIITDDQGHNTYKGLVLDSQLHKTTDNVIAIGIGSHVIPAEVARLATDRNHGFILHSATSLSLLESKVAQLICG